MFSLCLMLYLHTCCLMWRSLCPRQDTVDLYQRTVSVVIKTILCSSKESYWQSAYNNHSFNKLLFVSILFYSRFIIALSLVTEKRTVIILSLNTPKVSSSCHRREFITATVTSILFVRDLNLHLDSCKAALKPQIKVTDRINHCSPSDISVSPQNMSLVNLLFGTNCNTAKSISL